ncbi:hypothetical protein XM38_036980 [Halomicronema hongdechloris C2206]|uniref:DUF2283 domain-containing protein n=1 Tax=Halomicronema hongdechloris C2206 TaxID=1641165 RepID=A0A1Z3HQZ9_9CYAN|nr:DUF2283 domain-containing protein [Halomicronema hongdechloris]ASC72740.1 hypothetical protein XM38_036980 [Halomicronema hongdechloris C2206]
MALTQSIEISRYLNIAKALQTVEQRSCWMMFDAEADVLYINFQNPAQAATDSEVTDDDVVIRYIGDQVIGLTILSVSQR